MDSSAAVRVLLLADTHLGFDLPVRARVSRTRRGPDFFRCFEHALEPALAGEVDLVVHGGDLLFRSRVPPSLVDRALEPLRRVARAGVPVILVPGNHERSRIPYPVLAAVEGLHVLDRPRTIQLDVRGCRVAAGGFPFAAGIRPAFPSLVAATGLLATPAGVRLLCLHQAVEGARVAGYTFRSGAEVIAARSLPPGVAAILSGHIHRAQVLEEDLAGRPLAAPVVYPGSVERTSFAERDEAKGCWLVHLVPSGGGGRVAGLRWRPLPARPMVKISLPGSGDAQEALRSALGALPAGAVVQVDATAVPAGAAAALTAATLRRLAPPAMNVSLRLAGSPGAPGSRGARAW